MSLSRFTLLSMLVLVSGPLHAQQVIPLYTGPIPGSETWTQVERTYHSDAWDTKIVVNVVRPTLTAFLPAPGQANGTAVVIAPGGGFYALSIDSEGIEVAKWLAQRGVAAFVLKYRLVQTGADAVAELGAAMSNPATLEAAIAPLIPLAIADGRNAVAYVRAHAAEFGIAADRVGLMGFSAGGTIVAGVALIDQSEGRPSFLAPIYPYIGGLAAAPVPSDAPPLFVVAATDDDLGLAPQSVELYSKWIAAGKSAELHMYSRGGHGFGMRTQDLPADSWIERFGDWLTAQGFMPKSP